MNDEFTFFILLHVCGVTKNILLDWDLCDDRWMEKVMNSCFLSIKKKIKLTPNILVTRNLTGLRVWIRGTNCVYEWYITPSIYYLR
jgi:hypothetical protein